MILWKKLKAVKFNNSQVQIDANHPATDSVLNSAFVSNSIQKKKISIRSSSTTYYEIYNTTMLHANIAIRFAFPATVSIITFVLMAPRASTNPVCKTSIWKLMGEFAFPSQQFAGYGSHHLRFLASEQFSIQSRENWNLFSFHVCVEVKMWRIFLVQSLR